MWDSCHGELALPEKGTLLGAKPGAGSRRGFQKVSIRPSARTPRGPPPLKTHVNTGDPPKPSVGLEPTTPSLP